MLSDTITILEEDQSPSSNSYKAEGGAGLSRERTVNKSRLTRSNTIQTLNSIKSKLSIKSRVPPIRRKLVFVGDGTVGKTSMLTSFSTGEYPKDYVPTIFDNYSVEEFIDDKPIDLALWDTAGQEEYNRLRPFSYPDADCIVLCFAIDSMDTLLNVESKWMPELRHHCPTIPIILVGMKADLRDNFTKKQKCIKFQLGERVAVQIGALEYVECSAKTSIGVKNVIETAIRISLLPKRSKQKKKRKLCIIQ